MVETKAIQISEKKQKQEDIAKKHPINSHTSDNVKKEIKSIANNTSDNISKENKSNKVEKEVETEMEKEVKNEVKMEEKKEEKVEKKSEKKIVKKEEAVARGVSLPLSKKHSMYICTFIKGKDVDTAIKELNEVLSFKRAIPFKGEIPHRHDLGMMSGRYPIKATKHFIQVLKGLRGNILANGMDLEKSKIYLASANWASRPARRGGMRFKRAHVILKAKEMSGDKK